MALPLPRPAPYRVAEVYVYYYVHVLGTPETWVRRLEANPSMLADLAGAATARREDIEEDGRLELGRSRASGSGFLIRFEWTVGGELTRLSGDLSLAPVDDHVTQLSLRASYPSAGRDDVMGDHRRVEAAVKRLLDSITALPGPSA